MLNKTKILFLAANPIDLSPLRLNDQARVIEDILSKAKDKFSFEKQLNVRYADLWITLLQVEADIVHISGNGDANQIYLVDETGQRQAVGMKELVKLFDTMKGNARCVILDSCRSEILAEAISEHIDCVIGFAEDKMITDDTAIAFSKGFYLAISRGKDLETAFEIGTHTIPLEFLAKVGKPKIFWKNNEPKKIVFGQTGNTVSLVKEKKRKQNNGLMDTEISSQTLKPLPMLSVKFSKTIILLDSFIDEPSENNARKAKRGFKDFVDLIKQVPSEFEIEDEIIQLNKIKNTVALLQTQYSMLKREGLFQDAFKFLGPIQSNYCDSIEIIKDIQQKLNIQ